jgi:hypothetical protein
MSYYLGLDPLQNANALLEALTGQYIGINSARVEEVKNTYYILGISAQASPEINVPGTLYFTVRCFIELDLSLGDKVAVEGQLNAAYDHSTPLSYKFTPIEDSSGHSFYFEGGVCSGRRKAFVQASAVDTRKEPNSIFVVPDWYILSLIGVLNVDLADSFGGCLIQQATYTKARYKFIQGMQAIGAIWICAKPGDQVRGWFVIPGIPWKWSAIGIMPVSDAVQKLSGEALSTFNKAMSIYKEFSIARDAFEHYLYTQGGMAWSGSEQSNAYAIPFFLEDKFTFLNLRELEYYANKNQK